MGKKKCPDPEAHEKGDLLFPCDHFGAPITDKMRLDRLEHGRGVFYNAHYGGWRLTEDGGINDKPWHGSARQAIDSALMAENEILRRAERRAKKGAR